MMTKRRLCANQGITIREIAEKGESRERGRMWVNGEDLPKHHRHRAGGETPQNLPRFQIDRLPRKRRKNVVVHSPTLASHPMTAARHHRNSILVCEVAILPREMLGLPLADAAS